MTIQTLTSDTPDAGATGLPDLNVLAKLANDLFSALPGQSTATALPNGAGSTAALPGSNGLHSATDLPLPSALQGWVGAHGVSVPSSIPFTQAPEQASARPVATKPERLPTSLSDEHPLHASSVASQGAQPSRENRVNAQSFGLPGGVDLQSIVRKIVQENDRNYSPDSQALPVRAAGPSNSFYFLEAASGPFTSQPFGSAPTPTETVTTRVPFDVNAVRRDFPILNERVNGRSLIWFDNAATTQKPQAVIDRLSYFYQHENSNIHRAAHELAARATDAYEDARNKTAAFLGAGSVNEIVFVRGATEAINLVANTFGKQFIGEEDEIIVSVLEHHANIVPWHRLASETGARLRVIPVDDSGQILLSEYQKLLNDRTKLVAITQVSNALGTVTPVAEIIALAHRVGAKVLVDGAQAVSHMRVDVKALDADFYVFSGHKVFAPTGIGVLYGKAELLEAIPAWQGGGNMIEDVTFDRILYQPAPSKFEAGTGNIADAVGLGAAIDYVQRIGIENIARYEHDLLEYATYGLKTIKGLTLIGTAANKASVLSFVLEGYSTQQVGEALNREGIAVRSGHHCAQPILRRFGLESTVRPSLAFYNTCQEVDTLVSVLRRLSNNKGSL